MRHLIWVGLLVFTLVACGDSNEDTPPSSPTEEIEAPAGTLAPVIVDLQRDYEQLSASHAEVAAIWETLADNGQVQCGNAPNVLPPDSITANDAAEYEPLAEELRRAAIALDQASDLWQVECSNPRANPTPDIINQGLTMTRAAGDALDKAKTYLGEIQSSGLIHAV
jgi:hypothetical protein